MTGSQDSGGTSDAGKPQPQKTSRPKLPYDKQNWEMRLEAARAQREKVLKEKEKSPSSAPAALAAKDQNRTPFGLRANGLQTPSDRPKPRPKNLPQTPKAQPPKTLKPSPTRNTVLRPTANPARAAQSAVADLGTDTASVATVATGTRRFSVPTAAVVAFACFFGLGAGAVISYSAAVSMNWIGSGDASAQSQTPEVFSNILAGFPPVAVFDAGGAPALHENWSDGDPEIRVAALVVPSAPDGVVSQIKSPGPRFGATELSDVLVSRNDFHPLSIRPVSAGPIDTTVRQATRLNLTGQQDGLPYLPDQGTVSVLLKVANPLPPQSQDLQLASLTLGDDMPKLAPRPELYQSGRGMPPQFWGGTPDKINIFAELESPLTDPALTTQTVDVLLPTPRAGQAFVAPSRSALPEVQIAAVALPFVGPNAERILNLAETLDREGAPIDDVRLITYAPTSLETTDMDVHTEFLDATGFGAITINRVNYRVSSTHIRFYNDVDGAIANAIAEKLGARARDFTSVRNGPPPGRIEIYLEGESGRAGRSAPVSRQASAPQRAAPAPQRAAPQKSQLESSILNRLRRGAHYGAVLP